MTNALVFMMAKEGHTILAYLDDFAACHRDETKALEGFRAFNCLADTLGLKLAEHKSCPPTNEMEWLGYYINTIELKVSIPVHNFKQVTSVSCG